MDFTSNSKGHGSPRRFVLERKQRISIENRGSLLIKDTQTQVRELYRRDINKPEETTSSLDDTKILKTSLQVDALNIKIENEIDKLKNFRDFFLQGNYKKYKKEKQNLLTPTKKRPIQVPKPKEQNRMKSIEERFLASDRQKKQRSVKSSPNTDITEPVFQTMILTSPLVSKADAEPEVQKPDVACQTKEETFQFQENAERISGGCILGCETDTPFPDTTYQSQYTANLYCCQNYGGLCQCHVNPCSCNCYDMNPAVPMYEYQTVPPCYQQQPIAYGVSCCTCSQPTCSRRTTDLRTNYFCHQCCVPPVTQCSPNDPKSWRSRSSSPRRSGKRSQSRGRYPSANQKADNNVMKIRMRKLGVEELEVVKPEATKLKTVKPKAANPDGQKLKAARLQAAKAAAEEVEAAEMEAARLKAADEETARLKEVSMEAAKLEAATLGGSNETMPEQPADEKVIINGYVPAIEPVSKPEQDGEDIIRKHLEYMKMYKMEHDKSAAKESSRNLTELETNPTYMNFPHHTPVRILPSCCKPLNLKGNCRRIQNTKRGIEIIDRIANSTKTVKCGEVRRNPSTFRVDEVCSEYSTHVTIPEGVESNRYRQQLNPMPIEQSFIDRNISAHHTRSGNQQPSDWSRNAKPMEYTMQLDKTFPDRSQISDPTFSGYLSRDNYQNVNPIKDSNHNVQKIADRPSELDQNEPSYEILKSGPGAPSAIPKDTKANVSGYQSMDRYENVSLVDYSMSTAQPKPDKQSDRTQYLVQSPQRAATSPDRSRIPNQNKYQTIDRFQIDHPKTENAKPTSSNKSRSPSPRIKPHSTQVSTTTNKPKSPDQTVQSSDRPLANKTRIHEFQHKFQKMSSKDLSAVQTQHPQASQAVPLASQVEEFKEIPLAAQTKYDMESFCNSENINPEPFYVSQRLEQHFPETSPRSASESIPRSYTESDATSNTVSSPRDNISIASSSYENHLQCSSLSPSRGYTPLSEERRNQVDSENTEYATCQEYAQLSKGFRSDFDYSLKDCSKRDGPQEDHNTSILLNRSMNSSMQDMSEPTAHVSANSSRNQSSEQRDFFGNLSEQGNAQNMIPIKSSLCKTRTRLVTFKDEDGVSLKSNTVKTCRSIIDWERAHELGIKEEELDESDFTDDDLVDSCRSSSMADTECTCIESNNEDDYLTCNESKSEHECEYLPPFTGCPCMYQNYLRLAAMCD